jgi:UDP-N-acetylmuramate dehydrogenase
VDIPILHVATAGITLGRRVDDVVEVSAEAGHSLQDLVDTAVSYGLSGLETMTGIPGTVGAAPVQNVGAYSQEIADTLTEVLAWDWKMGRLLRLTREQCRFGHRTSIFKRSRRWAVLRATFALRRSRTGRAITYAQVADELGIRLGATAPLAETAAAVLSVRRRKGMVLGPGNPDNRTAGSVFVSSRIDGEVPARLQAQGAPVHEFTDGSIRLSASWLIKISGFTLGEHIARGVRISSQHYTLVADEGANAASFHTAIRVVMRKVFEVTGQRLEPELDAFPSTPDNWIQQ